MKLMLALFAHADQKGQGSGFDRQLACWTAACLQNASVAMGQ